MRDNLNKGFSFKLSLFMAFLIVGMPVSTFGKSLGDDNYVDGNYEFGSTHGFVNGDYATGRAYITGKADLVPGGDIVVSLYGGQFNDLNMNDGCITLTRDLILTGSIIYENSTSGTFVGLLGPRTVFLNKSQTLSNDLTFTGDIILEVMNQDLDLESTGEIFIQAQIGGAPSSLKIRNAILLGDNDAWLNLPDAQTITFENVSFEKDPYSSGISDDGVISFEGYENQFNAGFTLPKDIRLKTKYPFTGDLDLNGHTLTLDSDIRFEDEASIDASSESGLASDVSRSLFFNSNQNLPAQTFNIYGIVTINGNKYKLVFSNGTTFTVHENKTLQIKNAVVSGDLTTPWVTLANNATLSLDEVVFDSDPYSSAIDNDINHDNTFLIFKDEENMFNAGFKLPKDIELATKYPFSGDLDFNGYTLSLNSDLVLSRDGNLKSTIADPGALGFDGRGWTVFFNQNQEDWDQLDNLNVFNALILDGNGYAIDMKEAVRFNVKSASSLKFKNATLRNKPTADWLTLENGSAIYYDNTIFEIDPYSSAVEANAANIAWQFVGVDNMFMNGLTLPKDIELATNHPFLGTLNFNDKTVTLSTDIDFADYANNNVMTGNGTIHTVTVDGTPRHHTISFYNDQAYSNILSISDSIAIDGNGFDLDLAGGKLTIGDDKTLILRNMTLKNLPSGWLTFGNSGSRLVFDNVRIFKPHNVIPNQWNQISGDVEYFEYPYIPVI